MKKLCIVAAERRSKKNESIITTTLLNYTLAQLSCDGVPDEEQHWTIKNKHICSIKNEVCLTALPNLKDGGVFLNLMPYEESAKSQQWTTKIHNRFTSVFAVINVGTSMCLFEPEDGNQKMKATTTVKNCPQKYYNTENLFYFEQLNSKKKCSLI